MQSNYLQFTKMYGKDVEDIRPPFFLGLLCSDFYKKIVPTKSVLFLIGNKLFDN